jgi:hypothetical protein
MAYDQQKNEFIDLWNEFELHESAEAKFTTTRNIQDRLQPAQTNLEDTQKTNPPPRVPEKRAHSSHLLIVSKVYQFSHLKLDPPFAGMTIKNGSYYETLNKYFYYCPNNLNS